MKNAFLTLLFLGLCPWVQAENVPRPIQYVCVAFDGSYSLDMWDATMKLAIDSSTAEDPVHFTYFINSVYFLDKKFRKTYLPPVGGPGTAALDFAGSAEEIQERVRKVNGAVARGHEIASHTAGHRFGGTWTVEQWQKEFEEFNKLLFNYAENNNLDPTMVPMLSLTPEDIVGFRAPGLSIDPALYDVLHKNKFLYDTSKLITPGYWPVKDSEGLWNFGLPAVAHVGTKPLQQTLMMDYNFSQADTNLKSVKDYLATDAGKASMIKRFGTDEYDQVMVDLENGCYESMKKYFEKNYYGSRAPVHIGYHFSLFNDAIYWRALQRLVKNIAPLAEVRLVTYKELCAILNETPEETYTAWKTGKFEKLAPPVAPSPVALAP